MPHPSARLLALTLASGFAALTLAGCHVTNHKNGKNENVDIGTPFGSMSVKTNDNVNSNAIGLAVYPGATPLKEDGDSDAADVNLSFGSFRLGVPEGNYLVAAGKPGYITPGAAAAMDFSLSEDQLESLIAIHDARLLAADRR